jgi:uncharacterized protein (TIGR03083 family)
MFDKDFFVDSFKREAEAFKKAIERGSEPPLPPIPTCPDWNTLGLLLHLGMVHRAVIHYVSTQELKPVRLRDRTELLNLAPPYLSMLLENRYPADEPIPLDVLNWYSQGVSQLESVLRQAQPDDPVWFWSGDNRAGSWQRQMAFEAAIHRWDAENAVGLARLIEPRLANEAIKLQFEVLHHRRHLSKISEPKGETFLFSATDYPRHWLIKFDPDGVKVSNEIEVADVTFKGTASDLLLYYWRRKDKAVLEISGEPAMVDYFFELVPTV